MKISDSNFANGCPQEKFSLTGANEAKVIAIHAVLCEKSPIWELAAYSSVCAQLSPADVDFLHPVIMHPGVQSSDIAAIMSMRAPAPAPQQPQEAPKSSPGGLGTITGMDHRLGAWK